MIELKKYKDKKGTARIVSCCVVLFLYHGLRDYLIVGICALSTEDTAQISMLTTPPLALTTESQVEFNNESISEQGNSNLEPASWEVYSLDQNEGWSSATMGLPLATYQWASAIVLFLCLFFKWSSFRFGEFLAISLISGGSLALFSELSGERIYSLMVVRFLQGALQGFSLPLVVWMMQFLSVKDFNLPYFIVFTGPWIGSVCGLGLGGMDNPFASPYLLGPLSIITGIALIFLHKDASLVKAKDLKIFKEFSINWKETLSSASVWVCLAVELSCIWSLHTFLFGLSLTLNFRFHEEYLAAKVCLAVTIGGLFNRLLTVAYIRFCKVERFSKANQYRCLVVTGSVLTVICLSICGTLGLDYEAALMTCCIVGLAFGVGLMKIGVRLNLQALTPADPCSLLLLASIGNYFGGGFAVFLFPLISKIGDESINDSNKGSMIAAWLYPMSLVIIAMVAYVVLISTDRLPHQKSPPKLEMQNGGPSTNFSPFSAEESTELDAKSFKSLKSAVTFKSIASRSRGRTTSFNTIKDGTDKDFGSIDETQNEDCWSIGPESEFDMVSIRSSNASFNTVRGGGSGEAGKHFGVILSVRNLDTTSAWLTTHHNMSQRGDQLQPDRKDENLLFTLYIDSYW